MLHKYFLFLDYMFSIKKCKGPNARRQTTCRDILKTNFYYVTNMEHGIDEPMPKKQKRRTQSQNIHCYRFIPTQKAAMCMKTDRYRIFSTYFTPYWM